MPLRLTQEQQSGIDELPADLRAAAEAIGLALQSQLSELRPGLSRAADAPDTAEAELVELDLDREGEPDPIALAACVAAHRAYVRSRGSAEGFSPGALAIGRLLVWIQRAAMIGTPPSLVWIGPEARCPECTDGQFRLGARCALQVGVDMRRAAAAAVITAS